MPALPDITAGGTLTADTTGYSIPNSCLTPVDWGLSQLWVATNVGSNRDAATRTIMLDRRVKAQEVSIPLGVISDVDADGEEIAGGFEGVWSNVQDLRAAFLDPAVTAGGVQPATFVPYPDGPEWTTAEMQFDSIDLGEPGPDGMTLILNLVIAAPFAPGGS